MFRQGDSITLDHPTRRRCGYCRHVYEVRYVYSALSGVWLIQCYICHCGFAPVVV